MHRSGTSLAARAISLLGVSLGDPESLLDPGDDNTAGYWENAAIKEFDDLLLAELGGAWDEPPVLESGWESAPELDRLRERAGHIFDHAFPRDGRRIVGWKDPRASLLLPFWQTVPAVDTSIVVVRDPQEVADSLAVRNSIESPQAALLWLRYLLAAVGADPASLVVTYGSFFDDLDRTLERLADHVGVPAPSAAQVAEIRSSIDPGLRHHAGGSTTEPSDPFAAMAAAVWNNGDPDVTGLDDGLAGAIGAGWIRTPLDSAQLAEARANWVRQSETLDRRSEAWDHQKDIWARQREKWAERQETWTRREAQREHLLEYYDAPLQVNIRRVQRRLESLRQFCRSLLRR